MESVSRIEKLLERYLEATTTVAEEMELRDYFTQGDVASHLQHYSAMFNYFSIAKEERSTRELPTKPRKNRFYLAWASVAAVAVLAFGIYFGSEEPSSPYDKLYAQGFTEEEIQSAQMAISLFTNNFKKGVEGASYLEEFEKNTNRFILDN
ncbi:hypothetical protein [Galbibacter sp.]|jgi:hypothetical protein|uniref:hypothetical protein n=1 Tax=Galbibacter sp. TaxID=2918471 RepID=UPI003A948F7F